MRRFDELREELASHGVEVIALSKDTVEEANTHKQRDGLQLRLLADPNIDVIRLYGVEHQKALNFKTGRYSIAGIPLIFVPTFKSMAIPTSLLIDENGIIQWVDQAEDYRLRSMPERIKEAVGQAFDDKE